MATLTLGHARMLGAWILVEQSGQGYVASQSATDSGVGKTQPDVQFPRYIAQRHGCHDTPATGGIGMHMLPLSIAA